MAPQYNFIINPKSGSTPSILAIKRVLDYLRQQGCTIRLNVTGSLPHAGDLAIQAVADRAAAVVVAGGDGTVRTVAQAVAGSDLPILIIPCGTENLLARQLGIDGSFNTTTSILTHGRIVNLDLAQANERIFMAIAGIGFDAQVIDRVNRFRKGHISHRDYIWPICRTFWEYHFPPIHVVADNRLVCEEPALVFVSNISRYAVGLGICPHADYSDGLLDLTIFKCARQDLLLFHAFMTVIGSSSPSSLIYRQKCRHIHITSPDTRTLVQLDGDPGPALPLDIRVTPAAAKVLTPPLPGDPAYCPPTRLCLLRQWLLR